MTQNILIDLSFINDSTHQCPIRVITSFNSTGPTSYKPKRDWHRSIYNTRTSICPHWWWNREQNVIQKCQVSMRRSRAKSASSRVNVHNGSIYLQEEDFRHSPWMNNRHCLWIHGNLLIGALNVYTKVAENGYHSYIQRCPTRPSNDTSTSGSEHQRIVVFALKNGIWTSCEELTLAPWYSTEMQWRRNRHTS